MIPKRLSDAVPVVGNFLGYPLPLNSPLLIEVITRLPHCPFYIDCSAIQVHVGDVLAHRHPFLNSGIEYGLEPVHLKSLISYEGRGETKELYKLRGILRYAHAPLL